MQRLPKAIFSVLGMLPLTRTAAGLDEGDFAEVDFQQRTVRMRPGLSKDMEWPTFWHESVHVALFDAGVTIGLPDKKEEAICDAIATYLSAMMRAGRLKVISTK